MITKKCFLSKDPPEFIEQMLSETYKFFFGVFSYYLINSVLSRTEKSGTTSEMEDMFMTTVISTPLLYYQFIENHKIVFITGSLRNFKISEDLKRFRL